MPTTAIAPVSFHNTLGYDLLVYDSFSPATETAAENNYFGQLTQLGKIGAGATGSIQPIHTTSAFIIESAADGKPVKRCIKMAFQQTASFTVVQADEDAMTATFAFISFMDAQPADPLSTAFKTILKKDTPSLLGAINSFFAAHAAYSACTFQTYMMAVAYVAKLPAPQPNAPAQPAAPSYSLSKLVQLMGGEWPAALPDITVTQFTCNTGNGVLSISALADISSLPAASAQIAQNFASLFGEKTLQISIQVNYGLSAGVTGTRLSLVFDTISIPVGGGNTLAITRPEISIDINPLFQFVVFSISGVIPFNLMGKPFDAAISMTIDNVEASIQAVVEGDSSSFPAPPAMQGVHFDQFGLGIGLFFAPPGIAIGLQGKFHLGDPAAQTVVQLDDDTFVLVCSIEDEVPDPVYISFYVPGMDISQVLEIFTNAKPAIDVPVTFTGLSFKWAQNPMEPVTLPDGSLSQMGYGFSAQASIASFSFYGDVEIDMNNGLTASIEMSPVQLSNLFTLSGDGAGITVKADLNGNPIKNNQVATTAAMQQAIKSATSKVLVPPGGPVLVINTISQPILHLNAQVALFDVAGVAVEADINKAGILFEVDFGSVLNGAMQCRLSDFHNFYGSFSFGMNRRLSLPALGGVDFGSFPLNAAIDAHLTITGTADEIQLSAGGSFAFQGLTRTISDFGISMRSNKLADLVEAMVQNIVQDAGQLFSDITSTATAWANTAATGLLTLTTSVADVLKTGFQQSAGQVAAVMKSAGFSAGQVASGLKDTFNLGANEVAQAMNQAGYTAGEVAGALKNVFSLDQIASALGSVYGLSSDAVNTTLQQAGYAASDVANAFKSLGGKFADAASSVVSHLNPLSW